MNMKEINPTNNPFRRKFVPIGFNNHKNLDEFIQKSLDLYQFVDPKQEWYDATGVYSKFIISNKSAIPDLVIWNKKFNKTDCFVEANTSLDNPFPRYLIFYSFRVKFILKAKAPSSSGENTSYQKVESAKQSSKELGKVDTSLNNSMLRKDSELLIDSNMREVREVKENNQFEEEERNEKNNFDDEEILWEEVDATELKNFKVKFQALPGKQDEQLITSNNDQLEYIKRNVPEPEINKQEMSTIDALFAQDSQSKIVSNKNEKTNKVIDKESLFKFNDNFTNTTFNGEKTAHNNNLKISKNNVQISGNLENKQNKLFEAQRNHMIGMFPNMNVNMGQIPMIGMPPFFFPQPMPKEFNLPNNCMPNVPNIPKMQNFQQMMPNIPNMIPNLGNMNPPFGMPMQFNNNNIPPRLNPMNPFPVDNAENENEDEADTEENDFIGNMNINYRNINPTMFLENPELIVQKNLTQPGWFLMNRDNKILGNFNSLEMMNFLEDRLSEGTKMDTVSITDYETDIYFTPTNLLEILRESLPKLMEKLNPNKSKKKKAKMQNNFPIGIAPNISMNNIINNKQTQPNLNINVQYFKNDININSFGYNPYAFQGQNQNPILNNIFVSNTSEHK